MEKTLCLFLFVCVFGLVGCGGSSSPESPKPNASPAPAAITKADVEGIVDAKLVTFRASVSTALSALGERLSKSETNISTGAEALSEVATRVTTIEQNADARLNAEWKVQDSIRVRVSGESWSMSPVVTGTDRGWNFRKPKKANKDNFGEVCAAFTTKFVAQSGLTYAGVLPSGQKTMEDELFAKSKSEAFAAMDFGDTALQGLIATAMRTQRERLNNVSAIAKRFEAIEPENRAENYDPLAARAKAASAAAPTVSITPTATSSAAHASAEPVVSASPAPESSAHATASVSDFNAWFSGRKGGSGAHASVGTPKIRSSGRRIRARRADLIQVDPRLLEDSPSSADNGAHARVQ